ncbi:MAG: hypothetical protein ACOCUI_04270 [bacterium]
MKVNFKYFKRLLNEKQSKVWNEAIKTIGEKNEKRFYNLLVTMCKEYKLKNILPNTEEFLVAKTFMEKILKSEKFLKVSTQAGNISGVTPSLGMSAVYPSAHYNKKPVYPVDLKTIEKVVDLEDTKKDKKKKDDGNKKLKSKMKNKWINFLVSPDENEDVKMGLVKAKKESKGFYLKYGNLLVNVNTK